MERHTVPAAEGIAVRVAAGQRFRIVTPQGHQAADFSAFRADDIGEWLAPMHTWVANRSIKPRPGDSFLSRHRRPIVDFVEDGADGVTLLKGRILEALAADGVGPITASGIFDSELHQVAGTEPGSQPGEILRTIRAGYTQRGRVLRPALVVVAAQD